MLTIDQTLTKLAIHIKMHYSVEDIKELLTQNVFDLDGGDDEEALRDNYRLNLEDGLTRAVIKSKPYEKCTDGGYEASLDAYGYYHFKRELKELKEHENLH